MGADVPAGASADQALAALASYTAALELVDTTRSVDDDMEVGITIPGSESSSLTIGSPGDSHEQEADRIADTVIRPKSNPAFLPGRDIGKIPETDPAGPVSSQSTPGSEVGLDPRDDPAGPVSGLGSPGGAVSLDPRDDPMGPVSVGQQ